MALNLTNISTQNNQKCPTIIKETFILFYSLSNIATTFFIVPILPIILSEKVSWYSIGFFFCVYELGKFLGNILWVKLNQFFSSSLIVIISLILLSILTFIFGLSKSNNIFLLLRFFIGVSNSLPILSKNIYAELAVNNRLTLKLYILTAISTFFALLIPLCVKNTITSNSFNKFSISSSILSFVNIITFLLLIILIKRKYLKLRSTKMFIEMNNENNDNTEHIKSKRSFEKKKDDEVSSDYKNSGRYNSTVKDEENQTPQYEQINKRESFELTKKANITINQPRSPRNVTIGNVSSNNLGNVHLDSNNNPNIVLTTSSLISNKEIKYASIYTLMNINDVILPMFTVSFLYVKFKENKFYISLSFIAINVLIAVVNYPISKKIIKYLSQRQKKTISNYISYFLYSSLIVTLLIGILLPLSFSIEKDKAKNILSVLLFFFIISRNVINTNLLQCYQIYVTVDYHIENENMRLLTSYQNNLTSVGKTIFSLVGCIAYFLLAESELNGILKLILNGVYYVCLPECINGCILFLVKLYM